LVVVLLLLLGAWRLRMLESGASRGRAAADEEAKGDDGQSLNGRRDWRYIFI
jgi:hypothetical protein